MLTREENELLTRVGLGTLMGDLVRQYWLPFLYPHELEPDGPPRRVRLLGEDLVAFRDSEGQPGLLAEHCPHRGASLFFGRNEERGLRCIYHGWKFDVQGRCVDMPNEPPESDFKHKVWARAYPCRDYGGVTWAYMGPRAEPPPLPQFEWALVPEGQRVHDHKAVRECNWMQALEGDIDTSHLYFLHARLNPEDGERVGAYHPDKSPRLELVDTEYGILYGACRLEDGEHYYWRTTQFMLPIFTLFPAREDGIVPGHFWVPIDDENTLYWFFTWHPYRELLESGFAAGRAVGDLQPAKSEAYGWCRPVASKSNDFLIDREAQRTKTFTGIATVPLQDFAVTVNMGPIVDRTKEHLGTTDVVIIRARRKLLQAAKALREQGTTPPGVDNPELFRIRSCSIVLPKSANWVETLRDWHHACADLPVVAMR